MAMGLEAGIRCFNVESEPELEALSEVAISRGVTRAHRACASTRTWTPRPTRKSPPASPRTSSACRFPAPARFTRGRRNCRASRSTASTCISARRSPTFSRSTTPSRCSPTLCGFCAATGTISAMSTSAAGSGVPYKFDNEPPPHPEAYAAIVARRTASLDCEVFLEPGRLIVGNAGRAGRLR